MQYNSTNIFIPSKSYNSTMGSIKSIKRYPIVFVAVGKFHQTMHEIAVVARTQPAINKPGQHITEFIHSDSKHWLLEQGVKIQLTIGPRKHGNINLDIHCVLMIYLRTETCSNCLQYHLLSAKAYRFSLKIKGPWSPKLTYTFYSFS